MTGDLDHTTATCADGRKLMAWLDKACVEKPPLSRTMRKRLERWRCGTQATINPIHDVLDYFSLDVSQVPQAAWKHYDNGLGKSQHSPRPHA